MGNNPGISPLIYLNNAATTWPKPPEVLDEVAQCLKIPFFEHGRSTAGSATDYPSETRLVLAGLFHAENPDHFIFTQNATDSLNLLIHGFVKKQKASFHAITTDLEHNSVLRPLNTLAGDGKLTISTVPSEDGYIPLREMKKAVRPETRLIVMSHGSNVLGTLQDVQPVADLCADNDIFLVVDGAQTAGQVPINLSAISGGAFVFTGHKALFGIPGIGGFYLNDPETTAPVRQGGTGTDSRSLAQPVEMPQKFEAGTHNYTGIASLLAGIRFIEREGQDKITTKGRNLATLFLQEIKNDPNIILYTPAPDLPVVSFNIRNLDNDEAGYILAKAYNIITRTGLHCAPLVHDRIDGGKGCIRVSFSYLNTPEECRAAGEAVREVAEGANR
ncbi:aminotransferase class V-fold PLP-dependent enzyme [Methanoregula formicica]|uniref:Selenocysteine lyase n=1 Tax=Methanoregula formicica (strain DSM 22288 / NBRC 105244 / SMSP) TaxID=593750 RepID=L0HD54_METFS|nr:aminotransferase class V-fold PLP-dependent enzyme [Methanoregula formicica]AGB01701.1 selenocysteine lyase [Methanoregula formicica SMSP]